MSSAIACALRLSCIVLSEEHIGAMWRFVFAGKDGMWSENEEKARDVWVHAFRKVKCCGHSFLC